MSSMESVQLFENESIGLFLNLPQFEATRDAQGILVVEFHTNGGPMTFTAQDHTEFVDAFYRISQDRANKIVILTGTGGEFILGIDFIVWQCRDPAFRARCTTRECRFSRTWRNSRASDCWIEGHANVHSEYALLANVIVAGEGATFNDLPHFAVV